jgi:gas vesicle protein
MGLFTGTFVGAGLAMWLVPRLASEVRQRMTDSARSLGEHASEQYNRPAPVSVTWSTRSPGKVRLFVMASPRQVARGCP